LQQQAETQAYLIHQAKKEVAWLKIKKIKMT
jgi:hypothetical protein